MHQVALELGAPDASDRERVGLLRRQSGIATRSPMHRVDTIRVGWKERRGYALCLAQGRDLSRIAPRSERAAERARIAGIRWRADVQIAGDRGGKQLTQARCANRSLEATANRHRPDGFPGEIRFPGIDAAEAVIQRMPE